MKNKVIVVFGGAFNPPLNSHFSFAEQIVSEYSQVEKVIFLPVNSLYDKEDLVSNEYRYNMLKVVTDENSHFITSRVEIDKNRQLNTDESLKIIQQEYIEYDIWFCMGSDNLKVLSLWDGADRLVKEFRLLILRRDNDDIETIIKNDRFLEENKKCFIILEDGVESNLSSTIARNRLEQKKSIRYLTPDIVYKYIQEKKLFE